LKPKQKKRGVGGGELYLRFDGLGEIWLPMGLKSIGVFIYLFIYLVFLSS
jgi:hypothetical protein